MSFLQNLWRDLVDKRLWPVAIVLVLVAIAIPVLLGGGSSEGDTASAPVTPPAADIAGEVTVIVTPDEKPRDRSGKSRDPFKPLVFAKVPKAAAAPPTGATSTPGTTATGTGAGTTPKSTGTGGGTSTTPTSPASPTRPPSTSTTLRLFDYEINTSIRRGGTKKVTTRTGQRAVSYIPSADFIMLSFLGVKSDGRTASFLVSEGVIVTGDDRKCVGREDPCQVLELKAGQTVRLTRFPPDGGKKKLYRFRLLKLSLDEQKRIRPTAKSARARTASARGAVKLDLAPVQQVATKRTG